MKYFYHILRIIVGLVFIVSGLAKLYPIEPFENIFIDLGISNWTLAPFMARLVIAFEIFLGAAIVFSLWLKNKVYFLAQGTLLFFTGYLIYLLFTKGNNVDCGCFGRRYPPFGYSRSALQSSRSFEGGATPHFR